MLYVTRDENVFDGSISIWSIKPIFKDGAWSLPEPEFYSKYYSADKYFFEYDICSFESMFGFMPDYGTCREYSLKEE